MTLRLFRPPAASPTLVYTMPALVLLALAGAAMPLSAAPEAPATPPKPLSPQPNPSQKSNSTQGGEPQVNREGVDRLFERLGKITDETEGAGVARRIEEQWLRSGSATADLLMRRAVVATLGDDQALAVELLDRVLAIRPQWAEGWNRRAALFTLLGDDQRAALDLKRALTLEPRHYQALAALGVIFSRNDDNRNAMKAWRQSLALNPFQPELKERVKKLAPDVDGRDL